LEAKIRGGILHDVAHFGLRLVLGTSFIVHGFEKFDPAFAGYMPSFGIPTVMQIPLALAEVVPGILLIIGVMSRVSASLLAVVMLGAIFVVLHAASFTGQMGYEYPLVLLAANLIVIVIGPGRISLSHAIKRIPRVLQ
jgi:putative oxidoreductase